MRAHQAIDVHVELDAAEGDQPAAAILLDLALARRLEVLAVEARRVRRRREEARAEEQHRTERRFARRPGQRQPRPGADHLVLLVEKLVLPVPQASLAGIVEEEVGVVLVIVHRADDRNLVAGQRLPHRLGGADARLRPAPRSSPLPRRRRSRSASAGRSARARSGTRRCAAPRRAPPRARSSSSSVSSRRSRISHRPSHITSTTSVDFAA